MQLVELTVELCPIDNKLWWLSVGVVSKWQAIAKLSEVGASPRHHDWRTLLIKHHRQLILIYIMLRLHQYLRLLCDIIVLIVDMWILKPTPILQHCVSSAYGTKSPFELFLTSWITSLLLAWYCIYFKLNNMSLIRIQLSAKEHVRTKVPFCTTKLC